MALVNKEVDYVYYFKVGALYVESFSPINIKMTTYKNKAYKIVKYDEPEELFADTVMNYMRAINNLCVFDVKIIKETTVTEISEDEQVFECRIKREEDGRYSSKHVLKDAKYE